MAEAAIIFKDSKKGVEVGMDIPNVDEHMEMTPALYNATLISFIIERGYHNQFREEFIEEYEKMIAEQEGG